MPFYTYFLSIPVDVVGDGSDSSAAANKGFLNHADQTYNYGELEAYFASFPPGYRFKPDDEELVLDYLRPKVKNMRLPPNMIMDVEVYKFTPDDLSATFPTIGKYQKEWYFFSPRDRKYRNGDRPNRAAGNGYWKATGADKDIYRNKNETWSRRALVFYRGKAQRGSKTDWIMHEYYFKENKDKNEITNPSNKKKGGNCMRLDGWVLCKIYKKTGRYGNKVSNGQQDVAIDSINPYQNGVQELNNDIAQIPIENGVADSIVMASKVYNMSPAASTLHQYAPIEMYNQCMSSHKKIIFPPQVPFGEYPNLLDHPHNTNFLYMMPDPMAAHTSPMKGRFKNEESVNFPGFFDSTSVLDMAVHYDLSWLEHFNHFDNNDHHPFMTSLDNIVSVPASFSETK
ncbi:NAC domain-containing protein 30-like [Carica papaya]|uniref:NAC domain-containing protein 30-like n=1 Tax=Carica papaya TaxID=3649 RepID=UPI000B8CBBC5|nr:NAC domain-containing protein 30-like [Carica papaya]